MQRLFDTVRAKGKTENNEQPTKDKCSRTHFLVKPFKRCYLTKLANKTNQPKIVAAIFIVWLSLSNNFIYQNQQNQPSKSLLIKEQIGKQRTNQPKIVAAAHIVWLSLPKHTFSTKLKIYQKQSYYLSLSFLSLFIIIL